jgi:hypothetical protein
MYYLVLEAGVSDSALRPRIYSDQDRVQFYMTTGITPHQQETLEHMYDNAEWGVDATQWSQPWDNEQ